MERHIARMALWSSTTPLTRIAGSPNRHGLAPPGLQSRLKSRHRQPFWRFGPNHFGQAASFTPGLVRYHEDACEPGSPQLAAGVDSKCAKQSQFHATALESIDYSQLSTAAYSSSQRFRIGA